MRLWVLGSSEQQDAVELTGSLDSVQHSLTRNLSARISTTSYYHAVTHTPSWRAEVRKVDHAGVFLVIAGLYTPFLYYGSQIGHAKLLWVLVLDWGIACVGIVSSLTGWSSKLRKVHRVALFVVAGVMPAPFMAEAFGLDVYGWPVAGSLTYILGALSYALHWPDVWPGVFGPHEVFHVMTVVANALIVYGVERAFVGYR